MEKTMVTIEVQIPVYHQPTQYGIEDRYIDPEEAVIAIESHIEEHSDEIDGILLEDYNERAKSDLVEYLGSMEWAS